MYDWQSISGCGWGVGSGGGTGGKSQANSLAGKRLAMTVCDRGSTAKGRGWDRQVGARRGAGRVWNCQRQQPSWPLTSKHTSTRSQACGRGGEHAGAC